MLLDGSWFSSWFFYFDEADVAASEDDHAVGHACHTGAGEFDGLAASFFGGFDECVFDAFFVHGLPSKCGTSRDFSYYARALGVRSRDLRFCSSISRIVIR